MQKIDISGLDKVALLKTFWSMTLGKYDEFFSMDRPPTPGFDDVEAVSVVGSYIDYFCGRRLQIDISGDTADPELYDQHAGHGAFLNIVVALRSID